MISKEAQLAKARALMDKHGLHEWQIRFDDLSHVRYMNPMLRTASSGASGLCLFTERLILIDEGFAGRQQFLQIVKHEVAHALLGVAGHGARWLEIARKAGCSQQSLAIYER